MEQLEHIAGVLALTMGVSWASGINLYAAMAVLGYSGATGSIELPPDLRILENPLVIGAASIMYVVEFVVDKIPGVDTTWDSIHTFIRIPAGAMMASAAVGDVGPRGSRAAVSARALAGFDRAMVTGWLEDLAFGEPLPARQRRVAGHERACPRYRDCRLLGGGVARQCAPRTPFRRDGARPRRGLDTDGRGDHGRGPS